MFDENFHANVYVSQGGRLRLRGGFSGSLWLPLAAIQIASGGCRQIGTYYALLDGK